jgi:hypothetical protein
MLTCTIQNRIRRLPSRGSRGQQRSVVSPPLRTIVRDGPPSATLLSDTGARSIHISEEAVEEGRGLTTRPPTAAAVYAMLVERTAAGAPCDNAVWAQMDTIGSDNTFEPWRLGGP